jgi:hypothetical protein
VAAEYAAKVRVTDERADPSEVSDILAANPISFLARTAADLMMNGTSKLPAWQNGAAPAILGHAY